MRLVIGTRTWDLEQSVSEEFTALAPGEEHTFANLAPEDFEAVIALLVAHSAKAPVKTPTDLTVFLRLRALALDTFGIKALIPYFQDAFPALIIGPTAKATAKSLGFAGRGFVTKKEQHYVDKHVERCLKKLRPLELLDLDKLE
jgi:hypothetical protein